MYPPNFSLFFFSSSSLSLFLDENVGIDVDQLDYSS